MNELDKKEMECKKCFSQFMHRDISCYWIKCVVCKNNGNNTTLFDRKTEWPHDFVQFDLSPACPNCNSGSIKPIFHQHEQSDIDKIVNGDDGIWFGCSWTSTNKMDFLFLNLN